MQEKPDREVIAPQEAKICPIDKTPFVLRDEEFICLNGHKHIKAIYEQ